MRASDAPLNGEILPDQVQEGGQAFLYQCELCGRVVLGEAAYITEEGRLQCTGCKAMEDLTAGEF